MTNKILFLQDVIEQKLRKQKELEYYEQQLKDLTNKMFFLKKEIDLTNTIIDIISNEKVLDLVEQAHKDLLIEKDDE